LDLHALAHAFRLGQIEGPQGPITAARAILTRKSLLVMTESSVLKLRRPRLVDGYDQSLLSTRYGMTARERWLGRQLSPSTYLGDCVIRLEFDGDTPVMRLIEGLVEGEPVVAMRRLPDELRADTLLMSRALEPQAFDPIVDALVAFHSNAPVHRSEPFGAASRPAERLEQFAANIAHLWPDDGLRDGFLIDTYGHIAAAAGTLGHRVMEGRVREVHGELTLEHLFLDPDAAIVVRLDDGYAICDPHDGSDAERTLDTAEEIMRLALELELACGRPFADAVVERYASLTMDLTLRRVATFYRRLAAVRLASVMVSEGADLEGGGDPDEADGRARQVLAWITEHP